jgi:hypothetical protein
MIGTVSIDSEMRGLWLSSDISGQSPGYTMWRELQKKCAAPSEQPARGNEQPLPLFMRIRMRSN